VTHNLLTLEIGSTITKANAFGLLPEGRFRHLAQGFSATTIAEGDVGIGVDRVMADIKAALGRALEKPQVFINSSAAGGLRMTVHGLTQSMTARAAREAALGAGAIVKLVTVGAIDSYDLETIREIRPNIILLAGGVDYGEKRVVLKNAESLASLNLGVPIIYAGNAVIRQPIQDIFTAAGVETLLADNVFPDVDVLNIEPVRRLIQEVFNRHIIHAPGMARLGELTDQPILPTPGAVLHAAELFAEALGDCLVFDVGGATTDVHSVSDGSREWADRMTEPEPRAKRTVEGDLGVYVNAGNIMAMADESDLPFRIDEVRALPKNDNEIALTRWLCTRAVETAIRRHAGVVMDVYTPTGKRQVVKGKDLSAIQWVIGTGGALTRIPGGENILRSICKGPGKYLFPNPETSVLIDRDYLFSAFGTMARSYPEAVKNTFQYWVEHITEFI
jgi:uncharacterized protein (TIGR01319 family)